MFDEFMSPEGTSRIDDVRQLLEMRRATVARFKFFVPDAMYPVYQCSSCGSRSVSLSLVSPMLDHYDSFVEYVRTMWSTAGALPLVPCDGCGNSSPANPSWIALFTYLASSDEDLFLKLEDGAVVEALGIPPLGAPKEIPCLKDDADFLAARGEVFSHRWAWSNLIEGLSGKPGLHVKQVDEGWFFAVDTSDSPSPEAWTGWFADRAADENLDMIVLLNEAESEGFIDDAPATWLTDHQARALATGTLGLAVFLSTGRFRRLLEETLLQRGMTITGDDDPMVLTLDQYSCPIPFQSLLRKGAFAGYPPDRVLRQHLLKRLDHLEALRNVGERLRRTFDEEYLTELEDGCLLIVSEFEPRRVVRRIELTELIDLNGADDEAFNKALHDLLGFDKSSGAFVKDS